MRLWLVPLLTLALAACGEKVKENVIVTADTPAGPQDGDKSQKTNRAVSDKLVAQAEPLLSPIGFMYAAEIIDRAVKADPTNRKAQFYKLLLAPALRFRGFIPRSAFLAEELKIPSVIRFRSQMASATGGLRVFLNAPGRVIRTEAALQDFLNELGDDFTALAEFVKANRNFVTRVNQSFVLGFDELIRRCAVDKVDSGTYRVSPCPHLAQAMVKVNRADWEAILQMANAARLLSTLGNSYEAVGLFDYHLEFLADRRRFKTSRANVESIRRQSNLGVLRSNHRLSQVFTVGSDLFGGVRWLQQARAKICRGPRREHLFGAGICLSEHERAGRFVALTSTLIDMFGLSVNGGPGVVKYARIPDEGLMGWDQVQRKPVIRFDQEVRMDILAQFRDPVRDLKVFLPVEFDGCGNTLALPDKTMGGIFPDGNAELYLMARERNPRCSGSR